MNPPTLLITCHHTLRHIDKFRDKLDELGINLILPEPKGQQFDETDMVAMLPGCDVAICGDDCLNRTVLEAGASGRTKTVIRWGIGTDSVDKVAAEELGIEVKNTPGVFGDEVADAAWALILMLARKYHLMNRSVQNFGWLKEEGRSISGLTLGVVGLGSIGQAILKRGMGFGTINIGCDSMQISTDTLKLLSTTQLSLEKVLSQSDIIVLACDLSPQNYHMINFDTLKLCKSSAYIINVGRGPLVNNTALAQALNDNVIEGAALDVFETEPLPEDDPIRSAPNCVFGTHNGSNTSEAVDRVNNITINMAIEKLVKN